MSQEDKNQSNALRNGGLITLGVSLLIAILAVVEAGVEKEGTGFFRGIRDVFISSDPEPEPEPNPEPEPEPEIDPEPDPESELVTDVFVPDAIDEMYVFYQDKNVQGVEGCVRESSAQDILPDAFEAGIGDFIRTAKELNKSLIVTAHNPNKTVVWDGAEDITINGKSLAPRVPYWCNGGMERGFEYSIEE